MSIPAYIAPATLRSRGFSIANSLGFVEHDLTAVIMAGGRRRMRKFGRLRDVLRQKSVLMSGACAVAWSFAAAFPVLATPTYAYQSTIAIPGAASFSGYDLSTFDTSNQLYYLTDRTNNGIDVFSAATNSYVTQIGTGLFTGNTADSGVAGPNGISLTNTAGGKLLLAGNGASNVIAFNLAPNGLTVTSSPRIISTAVAGTPTPANRVDGVAYAPGANTILTANNASNPGFVTLINNATNAVIRSIPLTGAGGYPNVAGNGVEATIYNTARNSYFIAVPALSSDSSGNGLGAGGVIELDAATGNLLNTYDFNALGLTGACSPTGLVQGSGASVFVACSDPTASGSVILNPAGTGSIRVVAGIEGGDQATYDPTTNTFFEAARFEPNGPVLGIINAATFALQTIPIGANDHSVAVDPVSGEVFIATAATTAFANCSRGCIGVIAPVPEPGTLPVLAMALVGMGVVVRLRRS